MSRYASSTTVRWADRSLMLLNDLYQFTASYAYYKAGIAEKEAAFTLFTRSNPFGGGYTVASGLESVIDLLSDWRFRDQDLDFLAELKGNDDLPLFDGGYIDYLAKMRFTGDLHAVPEGTIFFPHEPVLRVVAPIIQAQLLETPLLNFVNFASLITTKYTRICLAAGSDPVLGFGLRRAQGMDGALTAERSAFIAGIAGTSNVLAAQLFGIPAKGTFPHSLVMAFPSELEAFQAYARALPANCIFLVDTFDTLEGVQNAIRAGKELEEKGHKVLGIRLDSGDLAQLSLAARDMLNEAWCQDWQIVASNDLDEYLIENLKSQGAAITAWGVGTKGITAYDQPALGGVYKLTAIRDNRDAPWTYTIKISEQLAKISNPGILNVRRFSDTDGRYEGDVIYSEDQGIPEGGEAIHLSDYTRKWRPRSSSSEDLLVPVFEQGKQVYTPPLLPAVRERLQDQLARIPAGAKRFLNPQEYVVGLERALHDRKVSMIREKREKA